MPVNKIIEVNLISATVTYDTMGVPTTTEVKTSRIGNYRSISAQEFYRAGMMGLKPDFIVDLWASEYSGEVRLEVNNVRYIIYRSYFTDSGRVELYCQKDGGA